MTTSLCSRFTQGASRKHFMRQHWKPRDKNVQNTLTCVLSLLFTRLSNNVEAPWSHRSTWGTSRDGGGVLLS